MGDKSKHIITRDRYDAVLFDLDGLLTDTAKLHAECWKQMFDEYLQKRFTSLCCSALIQGRSVPDSHSRCIIVVAEDAQRTCIQVIQINLADREILGGAPIGIH
jgi:beta-phosphoglucomutase-like phosphatase (HAD superfamily)